MYRQPDRMVLPELVSLGTHITSQSRIGGQRTDGLGGLEIGFLEHGSVEWWTERGLEEAGPGSIIIDRPGDWQGGADAIVHPCRRYWLRFNFPPKGLLPGLPKATIAALDRIYRAMETRHFPSSPNVRTLFQQLIEQQRNPQDFAEDLSRALFHQVLLTVVRDHQADQQTMYSRPVSMALSFFQQHLDCDFRIEAVAAAAGLSTGYFHELFLREVGYTPSQYHLRARVAVAKRELIHSDASITGIAMQLGFSSSQYFATAFRKIVGLTPGQYRTLREGRSLAPG